MNPQLTREAVNLGQKRGHIIIGTANKKMEPHIATAAKIELVDDIHVMVSAWFCPTTVTNLLENPSICLVVSDDEADPGYQLIGVSEQIENMAVLGCWVPEIESGTSIPQVERRVLVMVYRITDFRHGPHNDLESFG